VALLAVPVLLFACGQGNGGDGADAGADAAGVEDDGGDGGEPLSGCPDPANMRVHYKSMNPAECPPEQLVCTMTQNGFNNACGCGCIDKGPIECDLPPDPRIHYVSQDPAKCTGVTPKCTFSQMSFNNSCGCGCIDV
jgi:hypothetical protein